MKTLYTAIIITFLTFCADARAFPGTISNIVVVASNAVVEAKASTVKVAETNYNAVVIDILSGVRNAGSEIYAASKDAIHKSVDFVVAQAPDVVAQFLKWKLCEAIIHFFILALIGCIFFYLAYRCYVYTKTASKTDGYRDVMDSFSIGVLWKWIFSGLAAIIMLISIGTTFPTIVKIAIAPKVYVLEYVVDLAKTATGQDSQQR